MVVFMTPPGYQRQLSGPITKEVSMARPINIEAVIDSFLSRIGTEVAKGVIDGIQSSGLLSQLRSVGSKAAKGKPGRKRGSGNTCSSPGCNLPARAKGLCSKHYQQARYAEKHGQGKPDKAAKVTKEKGKIGQRKKGKVVVTKVAEKKAGE